MALTVEDGTGVQGAVSYATTAYIDTYWTERTQDSQAATWAAATTPHKEGAAREATAFLDAQYGAYYKGIRKGYVQGLLWPRSDALDDAGYPLPAIPEELKKAVAELAVRALSARLSPDAEHENAVKRVKKKVGPIETETEYADGASTAKRYGVVNGLMAGLVGGGGNSPSWAWA